MDHDAQKHYIRTHWRDFYPVDRSSKGAICPLCGSGSGRRGTGITERRTGVPGYLRCWRCGFSGDVLDLIMAEKDVSFRDAFDIASERLGLTHSKKTAVKPQDGPCERVCEEGLPETRPGDKNADTARFDPQKGYADYYVRCAVRLADPAPVSYLESRSIPLDLAAEYGLGFDPHWRSPKALLNGSKPPATPRLIIPLSDDSYMARDVREGLSDAEKGYSKLNEGRPRLFNGAELAEPNEYLFVTEGVFDALSVMALGLPAVALNGVGNAGLFVDEVDRCGTLSTVVLCLDSDEAGRRAAKVIAGGLRRINAAYIEADICCGRKDPNEALVADPDAFAAAVARAVSDRAARPDNIAAYIDDVLGRELEGLFVRGETLTGFASFDSLTGGLYPGLYVIAGTSALGKTTFALQLADQLAAGGEEVIFVSLEQSRTELVTKSLARFSALAGEGCTSLDIRKNGMTDIVRAAANTYKNAVSDRLSIVEGNFGCDVAFVCDYVRVYAERNASKPVVLVDYLQILPSVSKNGLREAVDAAVTELKRLSRELSIIVIVISSVNRASYLLPISYESIKESGGIEYTADVVLGLQLKCMNDSAFDDARTKLTEKRNLIRDARAAERREVELVCLKNRYGPADFSCEFDYWPKYDLFKEADSGEARGLSQGAQRPVAVKR